MLTQKLIAGFKSKLKQEGDCIVWTGAKRSRYYGAFRIHKKYKMAHRVAYEIAFGPIPEGMWILHRCDNPPCCNPGHLYAGTHKENTKDAVERYRMAHGGGHYMAKLTESDVKAIRSLLAFGVKSATLAREFGCSARNITAIRRGESWRCAL